MLKLFDFIKIKNSWGLKNEDSGQFINLEELSKIDKEKLKNALAPMRELEELIKISFNWLNFPSYAGLDKEYQ
jgi:CBS domain-containing protein